MSPLKDYMNRFNREKLTVENVSDDEWDSSRRFEKRKRLVSLPQFINQEGGLLKSKEAIQAAKSGATKTAPQ